MVAVASDLCGKIALVPLREIICVALMLWRVDVVAAVPFVFAALPLVKCLVHHEEAHLVTEFIKLVCMRVVACADGVASHIF